MSIKKLILIKKINLHVNKRSKNKKFKKMESLSNSELISANSNTSNEFSDDKEDIRELLNPKVEPNLYEEKSLKKSFNKRRRY